MAGIELYAPRRPKHRRTWTAAAFVLAAVFLIGGSVLGSLPGVMLGVLKRGGASNSWVVMAFELLSFAGVILLTVLWVTLFERRGLTTIGFNARGLTRFLRGYGVGLGFLIVVVGAIWALGGYSVAAPGAFGVADVGAALLPIVVLLFAFILQGSAEEVVFRGWLMQVIASRHGLMWGLGVSSALFGLAHSLNIAPSRELITGVLNIILFGVFIGLYAAREGSLWGVCGWHAAWNWLLGLGFGLEVSGQPIQTTPLVVDLSTNTTVPWWVTGAAFGPEASVVTTAVLIIGCLVLARRKTRDFGVEGATAQVSSRR